VCANVRVAPRSFAQPRDAAELRRPRGARSAASGFSITTVEPRRAFGGRGAFDARSAARGFSTTDAAPAPLLLPAAAPSVAALSLAAGTAAAASVAPLTCGVSTTAFAESFGAFLGGHASATTQ
jgi:hypothetical protein